MAESASQGQCGIGTQLTANGTPVAELRSLSGGGLKAANVNLTHLESPNRMEEGAPGRGSVDPLKFTANYTPASYAALRALWRVEGVSWAVVTPDEASEAVVGYLAEITRGNVDDGEMTIEGTVNLFGLPE